MVKKIILFGVNTGIGNVIMGEPLARKIKFNEPKSEITFVVSNNACKVVLERNPAIDKIVVLPRGSGKIENFFPLKGFKILIGLRKEKFSESYIIIPHGYYANFCSKIVNSKKRVAHLMNKLDFFNTNLIKLKMQHDVLSNLNLIGVKKIFSPKIYLKNKRKKTKKLIGIHPGCDKNSPYKRWPLENFISLSSQLINKGYAVKFFLGPDEKEFLDKIKKMNSKKVTISMEPLRKTLDSISKCNYFISNDSGLMHIAEALGLNVLGLFAPTNYKRTGLISHKAINLTPKKYNPWANDLICSKNQVPNSKKSFITDLSVSEVKKSFFRLVSLK